MMQVTRREASRALAVLRRTQRHVLARRRRRARPRRGVSPTTIDCALDLLDERRWIRIELVSAARDRLAEGDEPSADVVAEMLVRRAICDQLN
jgi:hypothetical protein